MAESVTSIPAGTSGPSLDREEASPGSSGPRAVAAALGACAVTLAAVAALYLFPYVTHRYRFPLGWDAAAYVARVETVAHSGLSQFGLIRCAASLLLTVLMAVTHQNAFTMVAVIPALLAGLLSLGAAGLVRAGLRMPVVWIPVVGFLTWAAFGSNGMMNLHLDNLLNAVLAMSGFAAAAAFVGARRGALATAILFMAAGLAHWPFYVYAMAVFALAVLLTLAPVPGRAIDPADRRRILVPLSGALAASGALVGLTFLAIPASGWTGARLGKLSEQLYQRFVGHLKDAYLYYPLPFAAAGLAGAATARPPKGTAPAGRRFFLALMAAWTAGMVLGGIAQLLHVPTAGARLLSYFFPATILTGVLLWLVMRWARSRPAGAARLGSIAGAGILAALTLAGFASLSVRYRAPDTPWVQPAAVSQVAELNGYVTTVPADRRIVFVLGIKTADTRPAWPVVKATLPASVTPRLVPYYGTPQDYLAGVPSRPHGDFLAGAPPTSYALQGNPVVLVVERFNPQGYQAYVPAHPDQVIGPGILLLHGPVPATPLTAVAGPSANTRIRSLVWVTAAAALALFVAGGGWAVALLPADTAVRVCLAPSLGAATTVLAALLWDRVGLSLSGAGALAPLVLAAAGGWGLSLVRLRRSQARPMPTPGPA